MTVGLVKAPRRDTEASGIAARIGIRAIPTLVLFKAGTEVKRTSGVLDTRSLVQWIE